MTVCLKSTTLQPASEGPTVYTVNSEQLDELFFETLVLLIWENVRPLHGVAALLDWRACGFLSELLQNHHFTGSSKTSLLTQVKMPKGWMRVFVFGLGEKSHQLNLSNCWQSCLQFALPVLAGANVKQPVLVAPASRPYCPEQILFVKFIQKLYSHKIAAVLHEKQPLQGES